jgi:hypothetical protein
MTAPAKPAKEGDDGDEEEGGGDEVRLFILDELEYAIRSAW